MGKKSKEGTVSDKEDPVIIISTSMKAHTSTTE